MNKEKRYMVADDVSLRAVIEDEKRYFTGYAAVYDKRSKLIAERGKVFYEYIERGAFDEVLVSEQLNCVLTFNHKRDSIMGRTTSGTLSLSTDDNGLHFKCEVPNTTLGNDTWEMVQRKDYPECSFVFTVKENKWERDADGNAIHRVVKVGGLFDVAIVVDGAYADTTVGAEYARAIDELEKEVEDTNYEVELEIDRSKINLMKLKNN